MAFEFGSTDLIQFSARAMCFENVNGDDIPIYPGLAVIPRADGVFALIDIWELPGHRRRGALSMRMETYSGSP